MRVSNPRYELVNQWNHALPTKELDKCKDIFFGILVSEMIKYKYDIITKCLVISPKTNPMKRGKEDTKV